MYLFLWKTTTVWLSYEISAGYDFEIYVTKTT